MFISPSSGWNVDVEAYHHILAVTEARLAIEVGVWKGATSIVFGKYFEEAQARGKGGVIISIDTWLGSPEMWRDDTPDFMSMQRRYLANGYPAPLYNLFVRNVIEAGVQKQVIPLPVPSAVAATYLPSVQRKKKEFPPKKKKKV